MTLNHRWDRRMFLGSTSVLAGMMLNARRIFGLATSGAPSSRVPEKLTGLGASGNVYAELGVTTVIRNPSNSFPTSRE
jgi:L-seryl-tRNA(Ser) seleniumtransferase